MISLNQEVWMLALAGHSSQICFVIEMVMTIFFSPWTQKHLDHTCNMPNLPALYLLTDFIKLKMASC